MRAWIAAIAVLVLCAGPAWAGKPSQVKLHKAPATIEGVIDPLVTVSPTVLTLKSGEQGDIDWTVQVPATEPAPATNILWSWPHPDGFIPISGWLERPGYTIPGYSISNQAIVTWDGGGYAESEVVTVEVPPQIWPAIGEALPIPPPGGTWQASIQEIQQGNYASITITVGAP